ncbi:PREDICTED: protein scylla [Drosophila arizonae]|uniref:Protein scylla n=1 Tax=Drosophila arizonae TaxID=7263 RepID=A0ABM1P417_DROAR|nr:PREDICTED: protein scylla [Drosophila arizonae]
MKMEVLAVQSNYGGVLGSNKVRDWTSTLTPPTSAASAKKVASVASSSSSNSSSSRGQHTHSIKHKQQASSSSSSGSKKTKSSSHPMSSSTPYSNTYSSQYEDELPDCCDIDMAAVDELSNGLLDKLREAKACHLTCTEVSLPCDLTPNIAADIIRVSEKEPCGIRGCTIYIEFEDEPQNSRRIASLKVDPETVSTFEVYLTLRQDHRGWAALLPQFMKSLARTITISPEYTITKHKLYSADGLGARRSYSFGSSSRSSSSSSHSQAIATPTI